MIGNKINPEQIISDSSDSVIIKKENLNKNPYSSTSNEFHIWQYGWFDSVIDLHLLSEQEGMPNLKLSSFLESFLKENRIDNIKDLKHKFLLCKTNLLDKRLASLIPVDNTSNYKINFL